MAPLQLYFFLLPLLFVSFVAAHNIDACKHLIKCDCGKQGGHPYNDNTALSPEELAAAAGGSPDCPLDDAGGAGNKAAAAAAGNQAPPPPAGGGAPDCPLDDAGGAGNNAAAAAAGNQAPPPPAGGGAPDCPLDDAGGAGNNAAAAAAAAGNQAPPPPAGGGGGAGGSPDCPLDDAGGAGSNAAATAAGNQTPPPPAGGGAGGSPDCPLDDAGGAGKNAAASAAGNQSPPAGGGAGGSPDCPLDDAGGAGNNAAAAAAGNQSPPAGGGAGGSPDCPLDDASGGGKNAAASAAGNQSPPAGGGAGGSPDCPLDDASGGGKNAAASAAGNQSPPAGGGAGGSPDCPLDDAGGAGSTASAAGAGDKGGGGGDKATAAGKGDKGGGGGDKAAAAGKGDKGAGKGGKGGGGGDKAAAAGKGGKAGKGFYDPPLYAKPVKDTKYKGEWIIHNPNVGVNAMQFQLMPNNKAVWTDTTNLGPSARELGPKGNCPPNPDNNNEPDCFAHAVQYDIESGETVSLYVMTDPWCSSGNLLPNGDLLSTGGNRLGFRSVRLLSINDPEPKFIDRQDALGVPRWYASNCVLEDGSALVVGGRDSYSYDIFPPQFEGQTTVINFPFLQQTTEPAPGPGQYVENNLYPFVFLLPDGNVFIFANDRAITFNPKTGETVKEHPVLQGGSRNYPPSGQSALFPLRLSPDNSKPVNVEVVVCGGNRRDALLIVDNKFSPNKVFPPANADCNRIKPLADKPAWEKEQDMPSPRTMGDLLILPNTQLLLINGAKQGCSGWTDGEDPNLTPTVYMPENEMGKRFMELNPTNIPRMYHSSSAVLPDGKILVTGSNAHQFYTFDGPYPTELRVEKFSPHYLDPALNKDRPVIKEEATDKILKYGQKFKVTFALESNPNAGYGDVILTMLYPPFTTHGYSQNQRMLIVGVESVNKNVIAAVAPPNGKLAPPGYYMMFVNHLNVPSKGVWVHID